MTLGITPRGIVLVIIASAIMAVSSLMLRHSVGKIGGFGGELAQLPADMLKLLLEPVFVVGVFLYAAGTLLWMKVISDEPISIGYPILISTSFIVVAVGAAYFFNEPLTTLKVLGMVVITIGVIIASFG
jgi:drug/metabolite transporter (DMT)-like permease